MFYAHFVLAKKGPLARIWLAAHWDKKLTKAHVFEINIESSVEGILQPKVKMALRTSGHLLLGIVRIYSRKAKYLLADCNEAFIKIKMAFRPGMVDLPEGNREAAVATITLPEVFHDFDSAMPDITIDMDAEVTLNQSRAEDITIKEDYGTLSLMTDDGFDDDMAFDDIDGVRDATNIDDGFDQSGLMFQRQEKHDDMLENVVINKQNALPNLKDTDFPAEVADVGLLDNDASAIFQTGGLFDEPLSHVPMDTNTDQGENQPPIDKPAVPQEDSDDDMYDMGPASLGAPSPPSSPESPIQPAADKNTAETNVASEGPSNSLAANADLNDIATSSVAPCNNSSNEAHATVPEMPPPPPPIPPLEQPFGHNEEESFALAPLDAFTIIQGAERTVKAKRKRKLIVDEVKNISGEEMKSQLSDTTDIVTSLDLAPPTKCLMHWKETGGVEKLFALPGHPILSKTLSRMYQRHLTTRSVDNEGFVFEDDKIVLDAEFEQVREEDSIARKRRREIEPLMPQDLNHIDPMHLDSTRSSYSNEHGISHHPLDVSPNFMPSHMFHNVQDQSQIMSPIMPPPPAHMMHQMLPPENMNPLPHGSEMMHSPVVGVDPVSQLSSMPQSIHEIPPPQGVDFTHTTLSLHPDVIESVSQHLMSNPMPSLVDNQVQQPPVTEKQLSQSPVVDQTHIEPLNSSSLDIIAADKCMNEGMLGINGNANNDVPQQFPDAELSLEKHAVTANLNVGESVINTEKDSPIVNEQVQIPSIPFPSTSDLIADDVLHSSKELDAQEVNNLAPEQRPLPDESDDDDYGAPSSVGPIYPEEQMADETYEQFEERILTKRTTHMLHIIHHQLDNDREVKFSELTRNNKRKQVAQKFYTFLVLKKQQAVELQQSEPYGDLTITKGPKFSAVYNAN